MRAFIAIDFDSETKKYLLSLQSRLKEKSRSGNFTNEDNFHLTLRFIGEVDEYGMKSLSEAVREAAASFKAFDMSLKGIGFFTRGNKCIAWAGIEKSKSLEIFYKNLEKCLMREGFARDRQGLSPHITLGREVNLRIGYDDARDEFSDCKKDFHVGEITLFESIRKGPKLIYKPIFVGKLK
ncbi:MAG: RNA 2',3'-cyclic phosphodiesterase [Clostridia bacterium]|jgi:2'-5' RNA ligase|nr:RNA 2',3'-cyclic phosphodiesterase [Clostridia bacterium]